MKINEMIFSDGRIIASESSIGTCRITFVDYLNGVFDLAFTGSCADFDTEDIECSVHHHVLHVNNGIWNLELFDDDNRSIFTVSFTSVGIRKIGKPTRQ
jgi:hypothetical protein